MMRFVLKQIEKIVRKGKNAGYKSKHYFIWLEHDELDLTTSPYMHHVEYYSPTF